VSVVDTIETVVDETDTVFDPSASIIDPGAAFFDERGAFVGRSRQRAIDSGDRWASSGATIRPT
jgi:hypothetical protein